MVSVQYIIAGNEREYVSYRDSESIKKEDAIFVTHETLKGRTFDKMMDNFILIGTWREREGIGALLDDMEAFQELGTLAPRERNKTRNPW